MTYEKQEVWGLAWLGRKEIRSDAGRCHGLKKQCLGSISEEPYPVSHTFARYLKILIYLAVHVYLGAVTEAAFERRLFALTICHTHHYTPTH